MNLNTDAPDRGLLRACRDAMQALTSELERWRLAGRDMDLQQMELGLAAQERLCAELKFLLDDWEQRNIANSEKPVPAGAEIGLAQRGLAQACAVQSAFLRRSRRSINVLMNVLSSSTHLYSVGR